MNSTIAFTTQEQLTVTPEFRTAFPALVEYAGKVNITAQATFDRWPEANAMRRRLWDLAKKAGVSSEQIVYDLEHANIQTDGGRW